MHLGAPPAVSAPTSPAGTLSGERTRGGPAVRPSLAQPQPQVEQAERAAQDATIFSIGVLLGRMRHAGQIRIKFSFGGETRYLLEQNACILTLLVLYVLHHPTHPSAHRAKPFTKPVALADVQSAVREFFHRQLSIFFVAAKDEV